MSWNQFLVATSGSGATLSRVASVSRIPNSMELWWIGQDKSVQGAFWYEGNKWQRYQLAPPGSASLTSGIAAVSRIPNSMELWYVGAQGAILDEYWYPDPSQSPTLSGANNSVLINNCANLQNLSVSLLVSQDLVPKFVNTVTYNY